MSSNSSNSGKNVLHSGTTHPELVCNSCELRLKGTALKRLSSFQTPATSEVPEPNTLLTKWLQFGGFYGPSDLAVCQEVLQNSGRFDTYNYSFIIKDTIQEQPKEGTRRARTERVLNAEFLCLFPMKSGHVTVPAHRCLPQPGSSNKLRCPAFLLKPHYVDMMD